MVDIYQYQKQLIFQLKTNNSTLIIRIEEVEILSITKNGEEEDWLQNILQKTRITQRGTGDIHSTNLWWGAGVRHARAGRGLHAHSIAMSQMSSQGHTEREKKPLN